MQESDLNIVFEAVAGSRLYGTFTEESDHDWRGVAIPPLEFVLGIHKFEQLESKDPDRVIYSIKKFFDLAADANPNILEMLFIPQNHWVKSNEIWQWILAQRDLFVSRKARFTFSGYAFSQLKRIKNHKRWVDNPPVKPDRKAMGLSIETSVQRDSLKALSTLPRAIIGDLTDTVHREIEYAKLKQEWDAYNTWVKTRNKKRHALEAEHGYDTKHAMHLVRLLRMGVEILQTGNLTVDRTKLDADELLSIRKGAWSYDKLIEYADSMDAQMKELYDANDTTRVSDKPDRKAIDKLLLKIYRETVLDPH